MFETTSIFEISRFGYSLSDAMQNGKIIWISKDLMTVGIAMKRDYKTGRRTVCLIDLDQPVDAITKQKYEKNSSKVARRVTTYRLRVNNRAS